MECDDRFSHIRRSLALPSSPNIVVPGAVLGNRGVAGFDGIFEDAPSFCSMVRIAGRLEVFQMLVNNVDSLNGLVIQHCQPFTC